MSSETGNDRLFTKLVEEVARPFQAKPSVAEPQAVFDLAVADIAQKRFFFVQSLLSRTRQISLDRLRGIDLLAGGIASGEEGYRRILAATIAAAALEQLQPV
ncbi:MAG TPA: hypothetical protein VGH44_05700 [Candidatus Saccharimonadia bacterium]|jgi:hypothetical protein